MSCPTPLPDLCLFTRGHLPKTGRIPLLCSKTLFPCSQLTVILASSDLSLATLMSTLFPVLTSSTSPHPNEALGLPLSHPWVPQCRSTESLATQVNKVALSKVLEGQPQGAPALESLGHRQEVIQIMSLHPMHPSSHLTDSEIQVPEAEGLAHGDTAGK